MEVRTGRLDCFNLSSIPNSSFILRSSLLVLIRGDGSVGSYNRLAEEILVLERRGEGRFKVRLDMGALVTFGTDTFGTVTFGTDTFGTDTFGTDTFGTDTFGTDTFRVVGFFKGTTTFAVPGAGPGFLNRLTGFGW